jgi:hypothetical protein
MDGLFEPHGTFRGVDALGQRLRPTQRRFMRDRRRLVDLERVLRAVACAAQRTRLTRPVGQHQRPNSRCG